MKAVWVARVVARLLDASVLVHVHDHKIPPVTGPLLHRMFARPHRSRNLRVGGGGGQRAIELLRRTRPLAHRLQTASISRVSGKSRPTRGPGCGAELGIPSDARVLALVGRFYAAKGADEMIRMMPAIVARCPDVVLMLVGATAVSQ
jgi:glycosyltransferase involved in cell wall biosynthesis